MKRAIFLDRDGVIIEDTGHPHEINKIKFLPGVSEAIKLLNQNGFKVIIITNQAGVAKGYFTEDTVKEINSYIQESLAKNGAFIDRIYYCPHHTEGIIEEYSKECHCRKPNSGMIEEAVSEFGIDPENSFLIGDKISDIGAGHRAGCKTVLLTDETHTSKVGEGAFAPDYITANLYEAVKLVINFNNQKESVLGENSARQKNS